MRVKIQIGTIEEALRVEGAIPEFSQVRTAEAYMRKFGEQPHLILIASVDDEHVGYKVGYALDEESFYSWLGGVLPAFRKRGVAQHLLAVQEDWVRRHEYRRIVVKSKNQFPAMLRLLIQNGYKISHVEEGVPIDDAKITFEKSL